MATFVGIKEKLINIEAIIYIKVGTTTSSVVFVDGVTLTLDWEETEALLAAMNLRATQDVDAGEVDQEP